MRQRIEVLLRAPPDDESTAQATVAQPISGDGPGVTIERYQLLEKIGEGGFGVVNIAEQKEPVRRKVALKVIKLGMDTRPLAEKALAANNIGLAQRLLDRHRPQAGEKDLRGWEWRYLWQQCRSDSAFALPQQSRAVMAADLTPDGQFLATADVQGTVKLWDFNRRSEVRTLPGQSAGRTTLAFSPNGKLLAMSATGQDQMLTLKGHSAEVWCLALAPDGRTAISGSKDGALLGWDLQPKPAQEFAAILPEPLAIAEFSADSRLLYGRNTNGSIDVWDAAALRKIGPLPDAGANVTLIRASKDGKYLVTGTMVGDERPHRLAQLVEALGLERRGNLRGS